MITFECWKAGSIKTYNSYSVFKTFYRLTNNCSIFHTEILAIYRLKHHSWLRSYTALKALTNDCGKSGSVIETWATLRNNIILCFTNYWVTTISKAMKKPRNLRHVLVNLSLPLKWSVISQISHIFRTIK